MLQSMTGYGRTEFALGDYTCAIEIRSLNGKQFEINTRIPTILKLYEIDLRNRLQQNLSRGSIDASINLKQHGVAKPVAVNMELAKYYYEAMRQIGSELNLTTTDPLATLMRMPDIVGNTSDSIDEEAWKIVASKVEEACQILTNYRIAEGAMLTRHISKNIDEIKSYCQQVAHFEKNRMVRVREKLVSTVEDLIQNTNYDKNRLEQEIIYYIEKFDITEEKNRLEHHCDYFKELLLEENTTKGKKLGFLLQEIGREINTMGSKANDVDIQKLVVMMKDELEKIKEQVLNVL